MTTPTRLYRFAPSGRSLGFIVVDRPIEQYEHRMGVDLTTEAPPEAQGTLLPYRINGAWLLQVDPPIPTPAPSPAPAPAQE